VLTPVLQRPSAYSVHHLILKTGHCYYISHISFTSTYLKSLVMVYSLYNLTSHPHISSQSQRSEQDYFTFTPAHPSHHWSVETPLPSPDLSAKVVADPQNPLLAARLPLLCTPPQTIEASRLLQLQTMAAHQPPRPRPQPHQDVLYISDDAMSSRSSTSSERSTSSTPRVCSRCQTHYGDFVAYSLNSYYCTRCAKIVGYGG
jgi:hypothetical protein